MEWIKNDNYIKRIDQFMHELIKTNGTKEKKELYLEYIDDIKKISPSDIFHLAMYQDNYQNSIEDIKIWANKFINLFHEGLVVSTPKEYNNLFLKYLVLEQIKIEEELEKVKIEFKKYLNKEGNQLKDELENCMKFEVKFIKMENILFPKLESKLPTVKPLKVLWSLHDDARKTLKELISILASNTFESHIFNQIIGDYLYLIYNINKKYELIIFPVTNQLLSIEELDDLYLESFDYGFAFIDNLESKARQKESTISKDMKIKFKTGELNLEQLLLIFNNLPVDVTFVDKNDSVVFYNETKHRHFPRNPSIIGRKVEYCHPPKSLSVVLKILDSFKEGSKDFAEFWIKFGERLIYITYYAIRDKDNQYMGVLEVSQDVTRIRELEGEQRILDWYNE